MAKQSIIFARWAHDVLGATVTFENPDRSYMWIFGLPWYGSPRTYSDARMSYCRYGRKYKKDTRFRVWGRSFMRIAKLCTRSHGKLSCGQAEHKHLGFDGMSTAEAAAYPPALCVAYASVIREFADVSVPPGRCEDKSAAACESFHEPPRTAACDTATAEKNVQVTSHGRVHHHQCRGLEADSANDIKEAEYEACAAGLRNAELFSDVYAPLQKVMNLLAPVMTKFMQANPEARFLHRACGSNPVRAPPSAACISKLRQQVGRTLGLAEGDCELHHPAATW